MRRRASTLWRHFGCAVERQRARVRYADTQHAAAPTDPPPRSLRQEHTDLCCTRAHLPRPAAQVVRRAHQQRPRLRLRPVRRRRPARQVWAQLQHSTLHRAVSNHAVQYHGDRKILKASAISSPNPGAAAAAAAASFTTTNPIIHDCGREKAASAWRSTRPRKYLPFVMRNYRIRARAWTSCPDLHQRPPRPAPSLLLLLLLLLCLLLVRAAAAVVPLSQIPIFGGQGGGGGGGAAQAGGGAGDGLEEGEEAARDSRRRGAQVRVEPVCTFILHATDGDGDGDRESLPIARHCMRERGKVACALLRRDRARHAPQQGTRVALATRACRAATQRVSRRNTARVAPMHSAKSAAPSTRKRSLKNGPNRCVVIVRVIIKKRAARFRCRDAARADAHGTRGAFENRVRLSDRIEQQHHHQHHHHHQQQQRHHHHHQQQQQRYDFRTASDRRGRRGRCTRG